MRIIALLLLLIFVTACTKVSIGETLAPTNTVEKQSNSSIKSVIEKVGNAIPDYETPGSVKDGVIEETEVDSFGNAI